MKQHGLYIGWAWITESQSMLAVSNPATGDVVAMVSTASREIVQEAIDAAYRAFPQWTNTPAVRRSQLLGAVAERIRNDVERLVRILTMEQGKPLAEARGEIN